MGKSKPYSEFSPEQKANKLAKAREKRRLNREANNPVHQKSVQRGETYMNEHGHKYVGRYAEGSQRWREENQEWSNFRSCISSLKRKYLCHAFYGGKCARCEETHPYRLTLDHIDDDGAVERAEGVRIYEWLLANNFSTDNIQCLCWNCQFAKRARQDGTTFDNRHRKMIVALGGRCVSCGTDNHRLLTVDHVQGGGKAHARLIGCKQLYDEVTAHALSGGTGIYVAKCISCNSASGIAKLRYPLMTERLARYRDRLNQYDIDLIERDATFASSM